MKRRWLAIGTPVVVKVTLEKVRDKQKVWWEACSSGPCDKCGVVTGVGLRFDGESKPSGYVGSYYAEPDFEAGYLAIKKTHRVYLVKFSLSGREYPARPEDLEVITHPIALPFTAQPECPESIRVGLREDAKSLPRDAKGRWVKS